LIAVGRPHFGGAIGKRQNHVTRLEPNALLAVQLAGEEAEWQIFQTFSNLKKPALAPAPEQHSRVSRVRIIKLFRTAVKCARHHGCQLQRSTRLLGVQSKLVIQRRQQPRRVANILEFVQQAMDVLRDSACHIPMPQAIRQYHPCDVVAAREHRRKVAATLSTRRHGDDVRFQPGQLQGTMSSLVTGPELHAAEGPRRRRRALNLFTLDFLELHRHI